MVVFNPKEAEIFQRVNWSKLPIFRWVKIGIPLVGFVLFVLAIFQKFSTTHNLLDKNNLGFIVAFFSLIVISWYFTMLHKGLQSLSNKKDLLIVAENNIANVLDFNTARIILASAKFARTRGLKSLSPEIFMLCAIDMDQKLKYTLLRTIIDPEYIKKSLVDVVSQQEKENFTWNLNEDFNNLFELALKSASDRNKNTIGVSDVFSVFVENNIIFKKPLMDANLKARDVRNLVFWSDDLEIETEAKKRFWDMRNLVKTGFLAKDWAAGYTVLLDQYSVDVTKLMRQHNFRKIFAHQEAVMSMEAILSRSEKNNVLIVGESGSSRRSMVEALANKCALGESLPDLNYRRVILLDLPKALASMSDSDQAESLLDKIFQEVVFAENIILVIDNFHNFIGTGSGSYLGGAEISGLISSYLDTPGFKLVGVTTFDGLHLSIEKNSQLLSLFEKVEVSEISEDETIDIIKDRALSLEVKNKVLIPWQTIRDTVQLSGKYITNMPFPEKAMGLIDEAVITIVKKKKKIVLPEIISEILTVKTQIPVGAIKSKEKETLLNLEALIHERIINQEEAVVNIAKAMRRARTEITIRKGPMGVFLFLGPTGVGKTETAKALAEIYFGSENKMIRLDMSEFQAIKDIPRLIGSSEENGLLTTQVRENPFSLILLDEFEKAHPNIINLFLQVFDEGHVTDGLGRKVSFANTIIIATSNAGYQIILQVLKELTEAGSFATEKPVGESKEVWDVVERRLMDFIFDQGIFRPELVNRFDDVVIFKPLTKSNLLAIAQLMLKKLQKNLKEKDIDFVITEPLKERIVDLGYDPVFGAREMRRVIQDKVENLLATNILSGKIDKGSKVEINQNFEIIIN